MTWDRYQWRCTDINNSTLPDEWRKEYSDADDTVNSKSLKRFISVLYTSEVLIDKLNKKKLDLYEYGALRVICSFYFAHTYHQSLSIYHLSKIGFGSSSLILSRSVVESIVNLAYLWQVKNINNSAQEREAWLEYSYVSRSKIDNAWKEMQLHREKLGFSTSEFPELFNDSNSTILKSGKEQFKLKYGRDDWAVIKSLEKRARKVDDLNVTLLSGLVLEEMYHTIYRLSSEYIHGTSGSSENYFEESDNGMYINMGVNVKSLDIAIPLVTRVMIYILSIVNHLFGLKVNINEQLVSGGFILE